MPEYHVTVTVERVTRTVTVEADDMDDARETALDQLQTGVVNVDREPAVGKVEMTPESVEELHTEIVGRLDKTYTLFYGAYDDEFTMEQIAKLVQGDIQGVEEDLDEWVSDQRYENAMYALNETTTEEEREALGDRLDDLRFAIEERDESDPLHTLARRTSDALVRYYVGDISFADFDDEDEVVNSVLTMLGITDATQTQLDDITSIVANAGGGINGLYLIWRQNIEELLKVMEGVAFRDEKFTLTVTDPDVLIWDTYAGAGYSEEVKGFSWSGDFDPSNFRLDGPRGYEDCCGGFSGGFDDSTVTFTKKEEGQ